MSKTRIVGRHTGREYFAARDAVIEALGGDPDTENDAQRQVDELLDLHEQNMGLGELPGITDEMKAAGQTVFAEVVPDGLELRLSAIGSQILSGAGSIEAMEKLAIRIAGSADWRRATRSDDARHAALRDGP